MNKHAHRLVFDRRRGMRVPAHEHSRTAGKAAGGQTRAVALTGALMLASGHPMALAQSASRAVGAVSSVPVSRADGAVARSAARSVSSLVRDALNTAGRNNLPSYTADGAWLLNKGNYQDPSLSADGTIMSMVLKGKTAILNWDSFDVANGYTLRFVDATGEGNRVLNRVVGGDASLLNGVISAPNTDVMIENGAGIIFGKHARVDTRSLIATALRLSDETFEKGLTSFRQGEAVFGGDETAVDGYVTALKGAEIRALNGGSVILVAPRVVNEGLISTPEGQTILAAGKTVYLYAPLDLAQRGLLVAVDNFSDDTLADINTAAAAEAQTTGDEQARALGTVENSASGQVLADKGTINLVGAAIRQKGQLTATTAVKGKNGAIFLQAMKDTAVTSFSSDNPRIANNTGTIELAAGSVTEVLPSVDGLQLTDSEKDAVTSALSAPYSEASQLALGRLRKADLENLSAVVLGQILSNYSQADADKTAVRGQLDGLAVAVLGKLTDANQAALNAQINRSPQDFVKAEFKSQFETGTNGAATPSLDVTKQADRDKLTAVALVRLSKQAVSGLSEDNLAALTATALQNLKANDIKQLSDLALMPVLKALSNKIAVNPDEVRRMVDLPQAPKVLPSTATEAEKLAYDVDKQNYDTHLALYEKGDSLQQASDTYFRSRIDVIGKDITLASGSKVQAPAGEINIFGTSNWANSPLYDASKNLAETSDGSRVVLESNARVDVSGLDNVRLPASRNQLQGRLFSIELKDAPLQRGGVLYRSELLADARRVIDVGDVSGLYNNWRFTAAEYSTAGGLLRLQSDGAMLVDDNAEVDFSGGKVTYDAGPLLSSLLFRDGVITRIENARRNLTYDGFLSDPSNPDEAERVRLGLSTTGNAQGNVLPEQVVGMSAGAAKMAAPVMAISPHAKIDGSVTMSEEQRVSSVEAGRSSSLLKPKDDGSNALEDVLNTYDQVPLAATNPRFDTSLMDENSVVNRAFALSAQPYLYTTLKPTAGWLQLGQNTGQLATQSSIVVTAGAPTVLPDLFNLSLADLTVSAQQMNDAGLAALVLQAKTVTIGKAATDTSPADQPSLKLAAGGQFSAQALTGNVTLNGSITTAGGSVALRADIGDVVVASAARLDVAGTVNDDRIQSNRDGVARQGGSVSLTAGQNVTLEAGSEVDVSGATWRDAAGNLVQGQAGSLAVQVNNVFTNGVPTGTLKMDATLSAFDANKGGTLKLSGLPAATVGGEPVDESTFVIDNHLYADRGFGKLDVSTLGNIDIAAGVHIQPKLVNKVAKSGRLAGTSAAPYELLTLEEGRREAVRVSFTAKNRITNDEVITQAAQVSNITVGEGALLNAGLGGSVALTASGNIEMAGTLQALGGSVSLGLLGARGDGGTSTDTSKDQGYLPGQRIHLTDTALLDVSGAVKRYLPDGTVVLPGQTPREVGDVLAGGTITLGGLDGTAVRGQLLVDQQAQLRLNGASAWLSRNADQSKRLISAAAGTLNIMNTDGFQLLGQVQAQAPNESVAGGSIYIALSQEGINDVVKTGGNLYPTGEAAGKRSIRITNSQQDAEALVAEGLKFGEGVVASEWFNNSGFDVIALRADESVQFNTGANIQAGEDRTRLQSVLLNTSVIDVADGAAHTVQAHHVGFGPQAKTTASGNLPKQVFKGVASERAANGELGGDGALRLQAGLIEVAGDTAVLGVNQLDLDATLQASQQTATGRRDGEIRFLGQTSSDSHALQGQLSFVGDLNLTAGQVYASTLSDYSVKGYDSNGAANNGTLTIAAPAAGSSSQTPLSALAQLHVEADAIAINGTVRQPMGSIDIKANTLTLGDHANLSVSADGQLVPVGNTINQTEWVYNTNGIAAADGTQLDTEARSPATSQASVDLTALPLNKQISLNGDSLRLSNSAVADASAGGDILAWEFKNGVGGSTDTYLRKDVFAILPNYGYDFAPFDTEIRATTKTLASQWQVGDKVNISSDNSVLAAGTYTLLDARYGILPGAVLVSAGTLQPKVALPVGVKNDDGSVVVSGYRTRTGTAQNSGNDQGVTFTLAPKTTVDQQSEILLTSGNAFQAARARRSGVSLPLPGDAGRIALASSQAFDWAAQFNLRGDVDKGLAAGQFDLSAPDMVVQADTSQAKPDGAMSVSLAQLNALGADSVLLGGKRSTNTDGSISIERTANSVAFQADTDANGHVLNPNAGNNALSTRGELLAVAANTMAVDQGLRIESTGADTGASRRYILQGDGAALQVGHLANTDISASNATGSVGALVLGNDSAAERLDLKGNSVQLDATQRLALAESTHIDALTLSLGGERIALGSDANTAAQANTVELTGNLLAAANKATNLKLRAYSSIDFGGATQLGSDQLTWLTLDAAQLRGTGQASDTVVVTAQNVVLSNTTGREAASPLESGASSLVVNAKPVLKDGHTGGLTLGASLPSDAQQQSAAAGQRLAFANTTLASTGDIVLDGRGQTVAQGNLTLSSARVTATSSADQTINAAGTLTVARAAGSQSLGESVGIGGKLRLQADSIQQQGLVDIASGRISLLGRGDNHPDQAVVFAKGSETRVDGRLRRQSDTFAVASGGGSIQAEAQAGQIQVDGLLSASAPVMPEGVSGENPYAGSIGLKAAGNGGAIVLGSNASIQLEAAGGKGGTLTADTQQLLLNEAARNAAVSNSQVAQSGLDQLINISTNESGAAHREVNVRVREGDVALNTAVKTAMLKLTADGGKLDLGSKAVVDATAPQGGVVQLFAQDDLTLHAGAHILAQSTREGANGGDVLLSSTQGHVLLGKATIKADSADDAADGRIVIRAAQSQDAAGNYTGDMKVALLDEPAGSTASPLTLQAGQVDLEAVRVYTDDADAATVHTSLVAGNSTATAWGLSSLQQDANAFASADNKANILNKLGLADRAEAHVKAGIEVQALGDLSIGTGADMNLNALRPGGEPIHLTVRAAGNIAVNSTLSDGFTGTTSATLKPNAGDAASLRLVAGADLSSANVLATQSDSSQGDLVLAAGKFIRTTAGSIDVLASGDIRLMSSQLGVNYSTSAMYVAGRFSDLAAGESYPTAGFANARAYNNAKTQFTERGGRLSIAAGGNVGSYSSTNGVLTAQPLVQSTSNYFYHGGIHTDNAFVSVPFAYWSALGAFQQGFGSFGGGNVSIMAAGDISNIQAAAPTSMREVSVASGDNYQKVQNGGNVEVLAGGNIDGGSYFLGHGQGRLAAGQSLNKGAESNGGAILALMDGQWDVSALHDINMSYVFNPSTLGFNTGANTLSGLNGSSQASAYFTYGDDAGVSLLALNGNTVWQAEGLKPILAASPVEKFTAKDADLFFSSYVPPRMSVVGLEGDVAINAALNVFPSLQSDLNVYAGQDVVLSQNLIMFNKAQASQLPSSDNAFAILKSGSTFYSDIDDFSASVGGFNQAITEQQASATAITSVFFDADPSAVQQPVHLFSGRDMRLTGGRLVSTRAAEVMAGRDLIEPNISAQHWADAEVTRVSAGRDIVGDTGINSAQQVTLGGPGALRVEAGRDINLNNSLGIFAVANKSNTALPDASAKITVSAGATGAVNFEQLINKYGDDAALRQTMNMALQASGLPVSHGAASWNELDFDQALHAFKQLQTQRQTDAVASFLNQQFVALYLPNEAGQSDAYYRSEAYLRKKQEALWRVITEKAGEAASINVSTDADIEAERKQRRDALFAEASEAANLAGIGDSFERFGSIDLANSKVHNLGQGGGVVLGQIDDSQGGIDVIAAEQVKLGLPSPADNPGGFINFDGGSFRAISGGDFLAGDQKVIALGRGNALVYSTNGSIDAGQGSNNASAKTLPVPRFDATLGDVIVEGQPPTEGAGIQSSQAPGDVVTRVGLYAPKGEIRALDAFIKGGKVEVVAPTVKGADNIGNSNLPPPPAPVVNLNLGAKASDKLGGAAQAVNEADNKSRQAQANSQLTVELLGFGATATSAGNDACPPGSKDERCQVN